MDIKTLIKELQHDIDQRILLRIGKIYEPIRDVLSEFQNAELISDFRVLVKNKHIRYSFKDIDGVKYVFTGRVVRGIVFWNKAETPFVVRRNQTYPLESSDNNIGYNIGYEVEYIEVSSGMSRVKIKTLDQPVNSMYFFENLDDIGSFLGIYDDFIDVGRYIL